MSNLQKIQQIAVVVKWSQPEAMNIGEALSLWLEEHGKSVCLYENAGPGVNGFTDGADCLPEVDLVIVLGGDGTLLSAARRIHDDASIMGVNLGGLGFLTEFSAANLYSDMERVLNGEAETEERSMLNVGVFRNGEKISEYSVLNDAVINKGALARMIRLHTYVDGRFLNSFRSDGLIVSSPTGSTAYSLSAGGPILYPTLQCISLTPICPFMLTNRPIILPDTGVIEIRIGKKAKDVTLTYDGQVGFNLEPGDTVKAEKSQKRVLLVKSFRTNYFQILRTRLKWGEGG